MNETTMGKFDRAALDRNIENVILAAEEVKVLPPVEYAALALLLPVLDAARECDMDGHSFCLVCSTWDDDDGCHPDCPVKACVESGLTK